MILTAAVLWLLVLLAAAFVAYVRYIEPSRLEVTEREVRFEDLPQALEGLRIVHLSDFHCQDDPAIEWSSREAVRLAMRQNADLIIISGDMFDSLELAEECACQLVGLKAPLGVWAVPGNHDRAHDAAFASLRAPQQDAETLRDLLDEIGITLLANESRTIEVRGASLALAGSDEFAFGCDDVAQALAGTADADFVIVVFHTPDLLDEPATAGADLVLCGHTHGGQIRLPVIGTPWAPVWRDRRRGSGLLRIGGQSCYVNRGVASATRARFGCRPEVAVLCLARGEEAQAQDVPVYRQRAGAETVDVKEVAT